MKPSYVILLLLALFGQVCLLYIFDAHLRARPLLGSTPERPQLSMVIPSPRPSEPAEDAPSPPPVQIILSEDPFLDEEERELHRNFSAKIQEQMDTQGRLQDPYLFVHIAKTGGTSLHNSLSRHRGKGVVFSHFWNHDEADPVKTAEKNIPKGFVHVVGGHLCYGIHHWWDNHTLDDYTYFTILREPISRVMSHYRYHLKSTDPNHHLTKGRSFIDWARNVRYGQNVMTGYMAGVEQYAWWNQEIPRWDSDSVLFPQTIITEEQYRIARRHLITSIVGLQEDFESSLQLLNHYLGLHLSKQHSNSGNVAYQFSEEERAVIAMMNHWDIELYKLGQYLYHHLQDLAGRTSS